jgi:hypothetical protein
VKGRFLLNIVVREGSSVFQLFSCKNKSLLIGGNSFLILDLGFNVFNGIRGFDFQSDSLSSKSFNENLHSSSQSKDQMESGFLLNVIIGEGSSVFQLFSGKNKSLLIGGNSFFVLDLGLDVFNGIRGFDFQSDSLSSKSFNKNLHSSSQS